MKDIQQKEYLIVEEHKSDYLALQEMLLELGIPEESVYWKQYIFEIEDIPCDLIFSSLDLEFSAPNIIEAIHNLNPDVPVIVLSHDKDLHRAINAIHNGAQDYLVKGGFEKLQLFKAIQFALERNDLKVNLNKSKKEFESLFAYNPIPLIVYNLKTLNIVRVNQAAIDNYGFTEKEFKALSIKSMRPEEEYDFFDENIAKLRASHQFEPTIIRHQRKNGEILEVEVSVYAFDDQSNFVIASLNDVTEEVKAKKALSDSNERFEYVTQATSDVIYDWDLNSNKITWGKALSSRFGHIGIEKSNIQDWIQLIHPEDKERFVAYWDKVLSGKKVHNKLENTYRIQKGDGIYAHVKDNAIILMNNEGYPYRIVGAVEDISERIEAEHKLRDSEEKYSLLFNKSPVPKLNCERENLHILDVNESAINSYGYTQKEFKKLSIYDLMSAEEARQLKAKIKSLINKEGSQFLGEWKQTKSTGEQILVEIVGHYLNMGTEESILFSCIDITENIRYKERLEQANERFEYVLKATYDAVWDWDIKKNELYWGENFEAIFGHKPDKAELNFNFWKELLHPDDKDSVIEGFINTIDSSANEWADAYRLLKKNGEYAYVEDKCLILRDEQGEAYRAIGSVQDITDRKLKEQQLELMESVVKNSNDAILITEGDEIDEPGPRIIFANEAFYKNTGYTEDEVIGRSPRFLQGPKTDRNELDVVRKALEQKESCQVELINYTKSGEEFWVEFSVVPVEYEGKTQFISVQRDITERKAEEERNELFRKMNLEISKPTNLKDRFEVVLKSLADYCDFELAEGWITNIDNTKISRITTYSREDELQGFFHDEIKFHKVGLGEGLPGKLWASEELVVWNDLQDNEQFIRRADAQHFGLQSAIAVPIFYLDKLIGAILLLTKKKISTLNGTGKVLDAISQRFGAELLRMKSEEELNTFFNLSPDMFTIIDTHGIVKKVNPAFTNLMEYTPEEVQGLSIFDITQNKDLEKAREVFKNIVKGNQKNYVEFRVNSKSGKLIWVSLSFTYDHEEELIYAVAKNITEQKHLEKLLQKTNELAKIGSWEYEVSEDKIYWSDTTREIYEVPLDYDPDLEEAIGFYEDESQVKIRHYFNQSLIGEHPRWEAEAKLITGQGNEKWVRVEGNSEWQNGKCVRMYGSIQDIHERKVAKNKLYETNLRYHLAAEATELGIWDWHIGKNEIVLDERIYELYGIQKEDFLGSYEELLDFIHPNDLEYFDQQVKDALRSDAKLNLIYRVKHPDTNNIRYLKAHAEIIKDTNGQPYRLVGVNYDITEEVHQQQELAKAYKEREDILESITDGFFAVDNNWIVTYWNSAAEKMISVPRDKIIGRNFWDYFSEVMDEGFYNALHGAMEDGEMRTFNQYYAQMGIWSEVSCFPRKDGLSIYFKDISEKMRQEQKILEMKNLQQYVINSTPDLIWAIDNNYELIMANEAYLDQMHKHTGIKYSLGKKVASYTDQRWSLQKENKDEWQEAYQKAFEGREVNHIFKFRGQNGEMAHYQVLIQPIYEGVHTNSMKIIGLACFSRDLTDKIRYINAIEDQNERLREIAWQQSHEVRAPLARIMALAKLILEDEEDPVKIKELLPHILDSTEELDDIIHDIIEKTDAIEVSKNTNN